MSTITKLLTKPENTTTPRLFVAATRQNDGKTTTCLGLFKAFQQVFPRVGYIKPIGQRFISVEDHIVDEDTYLFDRTYDIQTPIQSMSPVAIDTNFTRRYLDNPTQIYPMLVDKIVRAFDRSAYEKDLIIIEGSGHAGVGSVCDLSNAQVARLLGAKALIVSHGGIGRPVDEIALNKSLFDKFGVEVIGSILNKVDPTRIDVVQNYTAKALERLGAPLLGVIPTTESLAHPNLEQVVEAVNGRWLNAEKRGRSNRIEHVVVGAMSARSLIDYIQPGYLIITPGDREDVILLTIAACGLSGRKPLAGIILTRDILPSPHIMEMLEQTSIPVAISAEESYKVASSINSMTVKTLPGDHDKIPLIQKLINRNVDTRALLAALGLA